MQNILYYLDLFKVFKFLLRFIFSNSIYIKIKPEKYYIKKIIRYFKNKEQTQMFWKVNKNKILGKKLVKNKL